MKIVIMSDSHGRNELLQKILNDNADADYFYHLGDLCSDYREFNWLTLVRGNNDFDYSLPEYIIADFKSVKVLFTHGHRYYGIPYNPTLHSLAKRNDCQIIFYGHQHIRSDEFVDGIRYINPGALSYNRDFSDIGYLIMEIDNNDCYKIYTKLV